MSEPRPTGLLDPKNDYVFKRLLADSPDLLAALINAVRWRLPPVVAVTVKNPQIVREELRGRNRSCPRSTMNPCVPSTTSSRA